jgi:large subunit ribosomal protein L2
MSKIKLNLKIPNPTTPSNRHVIKINKTDLSKKPQLKMKIEGIKTGSGRNNSGLITIRHKGGGHKKKYRKINFKRTKNSEGIVFSIEYDPNRNAFIASIYDNAADNFYYILAPKNIIIGDIIKSGSMAKIKLGHSLPLLEIPEGSLIHNLSLKKTKKAQISRAAGSYSRVVEKTLNKVRIKLSSGEERFVSTKCYATIGVVSNEQSFLAQAGKAGYSRWINKRPTVRGVAMNPIDHPHGGGEGKKSGKGMTPWGRPVKKGKNIKYRNKQIIIKKDE